MDKGTYSVMMKPEVGQVDKHKRPTIKLRQVGSQPPKPLKRITTPTIGTLHVGNIRLHEAIMRVFTLHGIETLDLDTLAFFAMLHLDVTPSTYHVVNTRVKDYVIAHFDVKQGQFIPQSQVSVRRVMITYKG